MTEAEVKEHQERIYCCEEVEQSRAPKERRHSLRYSVCGEVPAV